MRANVERRTRLPQTSSDGTWLRMKRNAPCATLTLQSGGALPVFC